MRLKLCAALTALFWLSGSASADMGDDRIAAARDAATRGDQQKLAAFAAAPTNHVLEPYVQYWLLSARVAKQSETAPTDAIAVFLRNNAGTWLGEKLRGEWVKRLARESRWTEFNAEFALLVQPDQETRCFAIEGLNVQAMEFRAALAAQWQTLLDVPEGCVAPMQSLAADGSVNPEDTWQRFRRLVETKRFGAAQRTLAMHPEGQALSPVLTQQALESPARFLALTASQMTGSRAGRELVLAALMRFARTDAREAAARWQGMNLSAFRPEERAYMMGQLGWAAALAQLPEANGWFMQARNVPMSDEQRAWQVRAALRAGNWQAVNAAVEAMAPAQRDQADWAYWQGRALREMGRSDDARLLFARSAGTPSFYGILSTEALGQSFVWPQAPASSTTEEITQIQALSDVQRSEALARLNMRTESLREWNWALRGADDRTLLAAAEYARRAGLYDRAINTAERTRNQHDFGLRYLAPYYDVFAKQAQANSLDVAWVYGLVRQESRFAPVARSGVGAQGLMQVMPATGRWIAKKIGASDYAPEALTRVDTNVQLGTAYLSHVLSGLDSLPVMASAAYNAGPGRAKRWRDNKPLEGAVYAETIPITETRDYVKKVMANSVVYAVLFNDRPTQLEKRLGRVPAAMPGDNVAQE